jgi:hypothetical protein
MFSKLRHNLEKTDWDEYAAREDSYLKIFYAGVIILAVTVAGLCLFHQYMPW